MVILSQLFAGGAAIISPNPEIPGLAVFWGQVYFFCPEKAVGAYHFLLIFVAERSSSPPLRREGARRQLSILFANGIMGIKPKPVTNYVKKKEETEQK